MTTTPRERVDAALHHVEPDRVPWCELSIDPPIAARLMGWDRTQDQTFNLENQQFTIDQAIQLSDYLGLDNIVYVLRAPIYAHRHAGKDGRLFYGEGMIKARTDLDQIQLPDPNLEIPALKAFLHNRGDYSTWLVTRAGLMPTIMALGTIDFSYALYDDRALIEDIYDRYVDWAIQVAEIASSLGFDVFVTTDDMAFGTSTFFSPKVFRELCLPRYRRLQDHLSIPWVLHSDGNMMPFMDELCNLNITALHPIENLAMDIRQVKRRYGRRLCLIGNVDLNLLGAGTPEEVDTEVRALIRDIAPGGGYILSSGNSLAGYLMPDNILAMRSAVQKYGHYPIHLP